MRYISILLKNIKNLLPYLLLIAVYFFFVNLEARKEKNYKLNLKEENMSSDTKSWTEEKSRKISIPVVPYKE